MAVWSLQIGVVGPRLLNHVTYKVTIPSRQVTNLVQVEQQLLFPSSVNIVLKPWHD